jgi:hypothetical protein
MPASQLCAGDWVEVRSREEILATLDEHGRLDGMLFMPEMLSYCGKTLAVYKRAHKTCDTICYSGARTIERTVHLLESRCDGSSHGGCEAACALYWNEAWLKPAAAPGARTPPPAPALQRSRGCSMQQLTAATQQGHDPEKGPRYACQATELLAATKPLSPWDPRQYIEDYRSGNVGIATLLRGAVYRVGIFTVRRGERLGQRLRLGDALARALMACYDALQRLVPHGVPFPRRKGTIPQGQPTPQLGIGELRPGSRVRVKSYREILATLDSNNKTRGLVFDAEHVPYCDKEFPVRSLVNQIIDERTGYMLRFKSPSIILENVVCQGTYSDNRMFCPRAIYPYWRPVWLKPVECTRGEEKFSAPVAGAQRDESPAGDFSTARDQAR